MDERIEHGDDTSAVARSALGRREMLQRTGFVAGAAAFAWASPTIHTIGSRAAAASDPFSGEACVDADGNKTGAPSALEFKLVPSNADSDLNDPVPNGPWPEDAENTTVWYDESGNQIPPPGASCSFLNDVGKFKVEVGGKGGLKNFPFDEMEEIATSPLSAANIFTVLATDLSSSSNIFFRITPVEPTRGDCVQRFGFHFSCSQPLIIGDRHGSVEITGFTA